MHESDGKEHFTEEKVQEVLIILALPIDTRRMLAVVSMESFHKRQKMSIMDSPQEAGSIVGYNEMMVRMSTRNFTACSWQRISVILLAKVPLRTPD